MPIRSIVEELKYNQKRDICMYITKNKNKMKNSTQFLEHSINQYLIEYATSLNKKCKNKDILNLWLKYISEAIDDLDNKGDLRYIATILKTEIEYDLREIHSIENDDLDDKIEAICRQLIVMFSKEKVSSVSNVDIKKLIGSQANYANVRLIEGFTKKINSNRLNGMLLILLSIISGLIIKRRFTLTKNIIKAIDSISSKDLREKIKFVNVIFNIYIIRYINRSTII